MMPYGSYNVELWGSSQPPLVCWALAEIPPGPWDAESLQPFRTPHVAVRPTVLPGSVFSFLAPLLSYPAMATFTHPDGHGPITVRGVALVWETDPPALSSAPIPITPATTEGPGWLLDVPLFRTIIAASDED